MQTGGSEARMRCRTAKRRIRQTHPGGLLLTEGLFAHHAVDAAEHVLAPVPIL